MIRAYLPLWGMRAGWSGWQKVSTGWRTLSPQGWTPPGKQNYWSGPLFVCSLILSKIWQNINVKTFKDSGRNFKFGWRFDFQKCFCFEDATIKKLYLHLSCADMTLHVLTNRKIGHLVIFNTMIWIHQGMLIWISKYDCKHWTIYFLMFWGSWLWWRSWPREYRALLNLAAVQSQRATIVSEIQQHQRWARWGSQRNRWFW